MTLLVAGQNAMLNALAAAGTYVSLHSADPGANGSNELSGSGYARQPCAFGAASGGSMTTTAAMTFNVPAGTVAYAQLNSAQSGGTPLAKFALTSETFAAPGQYTLNSITETQT